MNLCRAGVLIGMPCHTELTRSIRWHGSWSVVGSAQTRFSRKGHAVHRFYRDAASARNGESLPLSLIRGISKDWRKGGIGAAAYIVAFHIQSCVLPLSRGGLFSRPDCDVRSSLLSSSEGNGKCFRFIVTARNRPHCRVAIVDCVRSIPPGSTRSPHENKPPARLFV